MRPNQQPAQPLVLWGYDASPFVNLVKETLSELELPYKQVCGWLLLKHVAIQDGTRYSANAPMPIGRVIAVFGLSSRGHKGGVQQLYHCSLCTT